MSTAFFGERAAQIAPQRYAVLPELGIFAQAPGDVRQPLGYPEVLPRRSFGDFLRLKHSATSGEDELQAEASLALRNPVSTVEGGQRHRSV